MGLVARDGDRRVLMPIYKKLLRKLLRVIFEPSELEPSELYLPILKQTNYNTYLLKRLNKCKLNKKPENSNSVFVIAKKK